MSLMAAFPAAAQDKGDLQKLADQWTEAYNKNDIAAVARIYTDDAVLLPPDAAMIKGREAIQGFWKTEAERATDLKVTVVEVKSLGPANAHAIFTSIVRPKVQPSQQVPGKGATLLQKSGEEWKIVAQVWNRDIGQASTGHGMMAQGMMGQGMGGHSMMSGMMRPGVMSGMPMMGRRGHMMKVMFAIAGTSGDGALSFDEVATIHKRIFDRVDSDKDGRVTIEEVQAFIRE